MNPKSEITVLENDVLAILKNIIDEHHHYFRSTLPIIETKLHAATRVDANAVQNIHEVYETFLSLKDILEQHIGEEEYILFPILKRITKSKTLQKEHPELLSIPLKNIVNELENVRSIFYELETLTDNYFPEANASITLKDGYYELKKLKQQFQKLEDTELEQLLPKFIS